MDDDSAGPWTTDELASALGWEPKAFADVFGGAWRLAESTPVFHDYDADPSGGGGLPRGSWHVLGSTPQLMLRVSPWNGVFLARPEGFWAHGTFGLEYRAVDENYLSHDRLETEAAGVVRRLVAARRRTFRYCRYCVEQVPPELRAEADVCMGCASAWLGVVY